MSPRADRTPARCADEPAAVATASAGAADPSECRGRATEAADTAIATGRVAIPLRDPALGRALPGEAADPRRIAPAEFAPEDDEWDDEWDDEVSSRDIRSAPPPAPSSAAATGAPHTKPAASAVPAATRADDDTKPDMLSPGNLSPPRRRASAGNSSDAHPVPSCTETTQGKVDHPEALRRGHADVVARSGRSMRTSEILIAPSAPRLE